MVIKFCFCNFVGWIKHIRDKTLITQFFKIKFNQNRNFHYLLPVSTCFGIVLGGILRLDTKVSPQVFAFKLLNANLRRDVHSFASPESCHFAE